MGNELLTQVGNVSSTSLSTNPVVTQPTGFNSNITGSLFNTGMNGKNYENDMMMPDWLKTGNLTDEQRASIFGPMSTPVQQTQTINPQVQTPYPQAQYPQTQYPQAQQINQPVFNGGQNQAQFTQDELNQYYNELLAQNPNLRITEKGNIYETSSTWKKTGIFAGLGTALFSGIKKIFNGETIKKAFTLKGLAIKLPLLGVAGWAIGSVIDAFSNRAKAKEADSQVQQI